MDDPIGLRLSDYYGEDNYAWASDYPHAQSTFPNSHKIVDENFAGVSEEVKRKITRDNVIKLYSMDLTLKAFYGRSSDNSVGINHA